ncbi:hypothetical protein DFH06DRAFT_1467457, partial [Mycena polygramma]
MKYVPSVSSLAMIKGSKTCNSALVSTVDTNLSRTFRAPMTRYECEWRNGRVYKVERAFPSELDEHPEEEISLIGQCDSMFEHFPRNPYRRMVRIMCDAPPPLLPIYSGSTGSKRPRQSLNESSGGRGDERKRAKTSFFDELSNPTTHSLDRSTVPCRQTLVFQVHLKLPSTRVDFPYFLENPSIAFIDKTHCIHELPARYKCLLLRPPRFGKSALLSTLTHYHDIHTAETFHEDFGALAVVTKAPVNAPPPDRHLCLVFRFSPLRASSSRDEFVRNLKKEMAMALEDFLEEYAEELLGHVDPFGYLQEASEGDLLQNVI